jgi:hypothetical protein
MATKDNSARVALITAVGTVVVALIGYLATHENKPDRVAYTGKVKEARTFKAIGNAQVAITEDQKVPQRFTTDSEGVFFAQLHRDTQTMLLEIKATGYQDYSRRGPTVRTGSEDIFLEPLLTPIVREQDPFEAELDNLRELHKVSLISAEYAEKPPSQVPKNSYGYGWSFSLLTKPLQPLTFVDTRLTEGSNLLFEIHKLADGHLELVAFVGPETFARYRLGLKPGENITFYSVGWNDAHNAVSVPLKLLACSGYRSTAQSEALDCRIR